MDYPLAHKDHDGWYSDNDYKSRGGKMVSVKPHEYLKQVKPLTMDDESRENIDILKDHIKSGGKLDPLKHYADGKEDGRHRAHAAAELGIHHVPVIAFHDHFKNHPEYKHPSLNEGMIMSFRQFVKESQ
jgi:hypothetical protein